MGSCGVTFMIAFVRALWLLYLIILKAAERSSSRKNNI